MLEPQIVVQLLDAELTLLLILLSSIEFASFASLALSCQCIWQHILFQWWCGELSLPSRTCRCPSGHRCQHGDRRDRKSNGSLEVSRDYSTLNAGLCFESTHQLLAKLIVSDCLFLHTFSYQAMFTLHSVLRLYSFRSRFLIEFKERRWGVNWARDLQV